MQTLLSCRGLGQCANITGVAFVSFADVADRAVFLNYTIRLAGEGIGEHASFTGGFFDDITNRLLHAIAGSTQSVCHSDWPGCDGNYSGNLIIRQPHAYSLFLTPTLQDHYAFWDFSADPIIRAAIMKQVAAKQLSIRVIVGKYAIQGSLNSEPLYVPAPRNVVISETASGGAPVCTNDVDRPFVLSGGPLVYSLINGDEFDISPTTGRISVQQQHNLFNFNLKNTFELKISVEDTTSGRQDIVHVNVRLADANNNPPQFAQVRYYASVAEDISIGATVTTVRATDADVSFPHLVYRLAVEGGAAPPPFRIDTVRISLPQEGDVEVYEAVITTTAALNREITDLYVLRLSASDGVNDDAEASVLVTVDDVNDHTPIFLGQGVICNDGGMCSHASAIQLREDVPIGTAIANISASDLDVGLNAQISLHFPNRFTTGCDSKAAEYLQLRPLNPANKQIQKPATATLFVAHSLDFEAESQLRVCVVAQDGGVPTREAMLRLTITISDVHLQLAVAHSSESPTVGGPSRDGVYFVRTGQLNLSIHSNGEEPPGPLATEYLVDGDVPPSDCELSPWVDAGPCRVPLHEQVLGATCVAAEVHQASGIRLQVRGVARLRDVYGLGSDCQRNPLKGNAPQLAFRDEKLRLLQLPGALEVTRLRSCVLPLCASDAAQNNGTEISASGQLQTVDLTRVDLMNQWPRNGYLRNHPLFDDWVLNSSWAPRETWDPQVRQNLQHTAAAFLAAGGQTWRSCDPDLIHPWLSCNVRTTLSPGQHSVLVRVVNISSTTVLAVLKIAIVVDDFSPRLLVPDEKWARCGTSIARQFRRPSRCNAIHVNRENVTIPVFHYESGPSLCGPDCFWPESGRRPQCRLCQSISPAIFQCRLDGAAVFSPCPMSNKSLAPDDLSHSIHITGLAAGHHVLLVSVADAAGNTDYGRMLSPRTLQWVTDFGEPQTFILSWPASRLTPDNNASFSFTCSKPPCTFECYLDGSRTECATSHATTGIAILSGLKDGIHVFTVAATDFSGNCDPTPAKFDWVVDRAPPKLSFSTLPGTTIPRSVSSRMNWVAFITSDKPAKALQCRFEMLPSDHGKICCTAVLGTDHACFDACTNGMLFDREDCSLLNSTGTIDARLSYSLCVRQHVRGHHLFSSEIGAPWTVCSSPIDILGLAHGWINRLEVTVMPTLIGSNATMHQLRWEWATDLMYESPPHLQQLMQQLVPSHLRETCSTPSVMLTGTLILAWSLVGVVLLVSGLIQALQQRRSPVSAGSNSVQANGVTLEHAMDLIHMSDMSIGPVHRPGQAQ